MTLCITRCQCPFSHPPPTICLFLFPPTPPSLTPGHDTFRRRRRVVGPVMAYCCAVLWYRHGEVSWCHHMTGFGLHTYINMWVRPCHITSLYLTVDMLWCHLPRHCFGSNHTLTLSKYMRKVLYDVASSWRCYYIWHRRTVFVLNGKECMAHGHTSFVLLACRRTVCTYRTSTCFSGKHHGTTPYHCTPSIGRCYRVHVSESVSPCFLPSSTPSLFRCRAGCQKGIRNPVPWASVSCGCPHCGHQRPLEQALKTLTLRSLSERVRYHLIRWTKLSSRLVLRWTRVLWFNRLRLSSGTSNVKVTIKGSSSESLHLWHNFYNTSFKLGNISDSIKKICFRAKFHVTW